MAALVDRRSGQRLLAFSPSTGRQAAYNLPSLPGVLAMRHEGGLLVGLEDGLYPFDPQEALGQRLVAVEADDARTDSTTAPSIRRAGSGSARWTRQDRVSLSAACIACHPTLNSKPYGPGIGVPNAIAFSPDGRTFYFADTPTGTVESCDFDLVSGRLGASRVFVKYPASERPDGAVSMLKVGSGSPWSAARGWSGGYRREPWIPSSSCQYRGRRCRFRWAGRPDAVRDLATALSERRAAQARAFGGRPPYVANRSRWRRASLGNFLGLSGGSKHCSGSTGPSGCVAWWLLSTKASDQKRTFDFALR